MENSLQWIECPRDAMQGIHEFIETQKKIQYIQQLLDCGFHTLDCGSFVSAAAIPQMADTALVLKAIESHPKLSNTQLLVIVANERGAVQASTFAHVNYLGFPFSVSETFQRRNTNSGRLDAFLRLQKINDIALAAGKKTVAYISMAFGNPYNDDYSKNEVLEWTHKIAEIGIEIISLADTVGTAQLPDIEYLFGHTTQDTRFTIGAHFHALPFEWHEKINVAYKNGCRRFDSALLGLGGCPMAANELTGNIPTEEVLTFFESQNDIKISLDKGSLEKAKKLALQIFP